MEERLRPIIKENSIINIEEVIKTIKECDDEILLSDYYEEVKDFSIDKKIKDLIELETNLFVRLEELAKKRAENKNILATLEKQNPNLTGLSIIETKKEKTDTDYLKYIDETNNIFLLECRTKTAVSELLSENADVLLYGTAKEVFDYFNKYKYKQMEFYDLNDIAFKEKQEEIAKINQNPKITNNMIIAEERSFLADYRKRESILEEAKVTINSHGERIYTLKNLVIKFRDSENKSKMEIISDTIKNKELEEKLTNENLEDTFYQSSNEIISGTKAKNIISKLYDEKNLTTEELNDLQTFIKISLNKMSEEKLDYDYQNTVDIYIVYLENKENSNNLSLEEKSFLTKYQKIIKVREAKIIEEGSVTNDNHQLKILPSNLNTNGAVVTVILLEVTILLGILISAIALVKR